MIKCDINNISWAEVETIENYCFSTGCKISEKRYVHLDCFDITISAVDQNHFDFLRYILEKALKIKEECEKLCGK